MKKKKLEGLSPAHLGFSAPPFRILTAGVLATTVLVALAVAYKGYSDYVFEKHLNDAFRLYRLSNEIVYHDEVLTMSANIAALTRDLGWEKRYRNNKRQLDEIFQEAVTLSEFLVPRQSLLKTREANDRLVALENRAFDMMRQNDFSGALGVLFSDAYLLQKENYAQNITGHLSAFLDDLEGKFRKFRLRIAFFSGGFFGLALALGLIWFLILLKFKKDESSRLEIERRLAMTQIAVDHAPDAVFWISKDARFFYANDQACRSLGYTREELMERAVHDIDPNYPRERWPQHWEALKRKGSMLISTRHMAKSGKTFPVEVLLHFFEYEGKEYHSATARDITERLSMEEGLRDANRRLEALVTIDPLTGMNNRRGLERIVSQVVPRLHTLLMSSYGLMIDLDDFKAINDTLGYVVGDNVLREAAARINAILRSTDYVARVGGDEFMVLLPGAREAEAGIVAEKVKLEISKVAIGVSSGQTVSISASLGLFELSRERVTVEELLERARYALLRSKTQGKNMVSFSSRDGQTVTGCDSSVMNALDLMQTDQFLQVLAQPIVRLAGRAPVAYELLSRLRHPEFGLPDDFFRIARQANILGMVDRLCFKKCLAFCRTSDPRLRFHVNLLPSTLLGFSRGHLAEEFCPQEMAGRLCVEISEQQLIGDPSCLAEITKAIKALEISIAIDDVGFGSTCLESIVLLEPDMVKIDKKCVKNLAGDVWARRSLERILKIVRSCEAVPVAEGIETEEDLKVLMDLGVEYGQGFLFGVPSL